MVGAANGDMDGDGKNGGERAVARTGHKILYVCCRYVYTYTEDASV